LFLPTDLSKRPTARALRRVFESARIRSTHLTPSVIA
jgi:hypothetical protein